jgi:hypothetical protein
MLPNNKYLLIIKIPFESADDMDARIEERKMVEVLKKSISLDHAEIKLQEVFENKAPRGIAL